MSSSASDCVIKLCISGAIHRVRLSAPHVAELRARAAEIIGTVPAFAVMLSFLDEEADRISISTDADLVEALQFAQENGNKLLRVDVGLESLPTAAESVTGACDAENSGATSVILRATDFATQPSSVTLTSVCMVEGESKAGEPEEDIVSIVSALNTEDVSHGYDECFLPSGGCYQSNRSSRGGCSSVKAT